MNQRERDGDSLAINELGPNECLITARESRFFQDLLQGAFPFGFFQEKSNCVLKIRQCFPFRRSAGRDIQFGSVRYKHLALFENLAGELNFHRAKYSISKG